MSRFVITVKAQPSLSFTGVEFALTKIVSFEGIWSADWWEQCSSRTIESLKCIAEYIRKLVRIPTSNYYVCIDNESNVTINNTPHIHHCEFSSVN